MNPQSGRHGLVSQVSKVFESDWHAQVSLKPFQPPDASHGYVFRFWGRAAPNKAGGERPTPKVVLQDALLRTPVSAHSMCMCLTA